MLTLKQQNAVLTFLAQIQAQTLASAVECVEDDNTCDNTVRIYDSACIAEIYATLANMYTVDDDNVLSYTFNADTVLDNFSMLDTEYRDYVHESLMQYDDNLSVAIYGKTFAQYCAEIDAKFAKIFANA